MDHAVFSDFFRFPHTPHLAWLGNGSPRDDKVLSPHEVTALLVTCSRYFGPPIT
jgi:hypothetical protein